MCKNGGTRIIIDASRFTRCYWLLLVACQCARRARRDACACTFRLTLAVWPSDCNYRRAGASLWAAYTARVASAEESLSRPRDWRRIVPLGATGVAWRLGGPAMPAFGRRRALAASGAWHMRRRVRGGRTLRGAAVLVVAAVLFAATVLTVWRLRGAVSAAFPNLALGTCRGMLRRVNRSPHSVRTLTARLCGATAENMSCHVLHFLLPWLLCPEPVTCLRVYPHTFER